MINDTPTTVNPRLKNGLRFNDVSEVIQIIHPMFTDEYNRLVLEICHLIGIDDDSWEGSKETLNYLRQI